MAAAVLPARASVVPSLSEEAADGVDGAAPSEVCRLRVSYGGRFVQDAAGHWRYQGGESHLESIPTKWRYADLMHRLAERCDGAVALKYFEPNDEVHPDNLLTVSDDDDLQEMFAEYFRALRQPATPVRTFRLRAVLFPAVEQSMTEEELADGAEFFTTSEALSKAGSSRALVVLGSGSAARRGSVGSSSSNGDRVVSAGTRVALTAQRSWWQEGVQAGWVPPGGAHTEPAGQLLLEGAGGNEQLEGASNTHSPHYYHEQGLGSNIGVTAGGLPLDPDVVFQNYDKYGDQYGDQSLQWGTYDAHQQAGDVYHFDHQGYSGEGVQYGSQHPALDDGWTDELVGKLAAVTTNGGNVSVRVLGRSNSAAPSSAAISRTASVVAAAGAFGLAAAQQQGQGSAWPTPRASPRTTPVAVAALGGGQLAPAAYWEVAPRAASVTPRAYTQPAAVLTQTTGITGSTIHGLSAGVSPHAVSSTARLHTKDVLPSHISAFGDGSSGAFGSSAGGGAGLRGLDSSASIRRGLDCLPDHLFSLDGQQPSHQTASSMAAAAMGGGVDAGLNGQHSSGRAGVTEAADMLAAFRADAEGEWAATVVANAGLENDKDVELLAYNAAVQPFTPRALPETPRAADRAAFAEQLRQVSAGSVSSASLPINGVHRVLKEDLNILGPIGEGAFGAVSLAHSPVFGKVATKWLKPGKVERHTDSFLQEAATLQKVNHPNVLRFYGVVLDSDAAQSVVGIITEYLPDGSLSAYLRRQREYLPLSKRTALALDAAKGLAYLHAMDIVHFDLKPDNLLLDGAAVKVADFGLAKHKTRNFVSGVKDLRGTLPYMAPEVVNDPQHVSEKADVWSLGMVLWELLTLEIPFASLSPQHIIHGLMLGNLQPPIPEWCEEEWRNLMDLCWVVNPAARPSMRDLCRQLERVLQHALQHGL